MVPEASVPNFVVGWSVAALLGGGFVILQLRRAGLRAGQISFVCLALVAALLVGSKLLYVLEVWSSWFPNRAALVATLRSPQMRIPGGFLLAAAVAPLALFIGVRPLWLADATVPAAGLCILGIRIGCFLEGCCYGTPSSLPWAVRFPAWTDAFRWQLAHGLVWFDAPATLPVHPLQLYFGLAGVLMFVGLLAYQRRKRYEGELLVLFGLAYLWSTWLLEQLRARPHDFSRHTVLEGAVLLTVLATVIEWHLRVARRKPFPALRPATPERVSATCS